MTVTMSNGVEIKVPAQLPGPLARLLVSHKVPALHARNVRAMYTRLALMCCDCASMDHMIAIPTVSTMN